MNLRKISRMGKRVGGVANRMGKYYNTSKAARAGKFY